MSTGVAIRSAPPVVDDVLPPLRPAVLRGWTAEWGGGETARQLVARRAAAEDATAELERRYAEVVRCRGYTCLTCDM